jgi:toxin ParE1/3/4
MTVGFTEPALKDFEKIAEKSKRIFGTSVAAELEKWFRLSIERIGATPGLGGRVAGRPGVYSLPLVRYPFRIYYHILTNAVEILHVRHTARRSWEGDRE